MRVLHVIPSLSKDDGGPTHAVLAMEQVLASNGVIVDVATTFDREEHLPMLKESAHRYFFARRLQFYKVAPGFVKWVMLHVREYDVVHIHALFSFVSVVAAITAAHAGVPYIVRPLGTLNRYGIEERRPLIKRLSLAVIEGPLLRRAAAVHFTSEAERAEALMTGIPMRTVVLPLGVAEFVPPGDTVLRTEFPSLHAQRFLLFMSRIDPKKNLEAVIQAFAQLNRQYPDLRLVLAGSGGENYKESLRVLTGELGVEHAVVWTGFVTGQAKAALHAAAELFLLPSYSENFGIAAAEALMAGLPCILGRGVALAQEAEVVGAAISVSPDPVSVLAAMQMVLEDPVRRHAMRTAARQFASAHYSLSAMGRGLVELYHSVQLQTSAPT